MSRVKEHATRVVMLIAAAGFLLSTVGITIAYFMQVNEQNQQQKLIQDLKQQQSSQSQQASRPEALPLDGYSAEPFDKASVSELKIETLKEGEGAAATAQSTVKANYFGWTADGKIFDSSKKQGMPAEAIEFPLNQVIPGWTEGLTGAKAGSTIKLTIPAGKAYGQAGSPPNIGPNEPLSFIVELVEVK